VLPPSSLSKW